MTQLLLPPAPPEIERYEIAKEKFAWLGRDSFPAIKRFSEAIGPVVEAIKQMCEAFASMQDYLPIPTHKLELAKSMTRYALAGHPLGKSHKGRKRWERRRRVERGLQ